MEKLYSIEPDLSAGLLKLGMWGFWTPAAMSEFELELQEALAKLEKANFGSGRFDAIVDLREHPVQSREVAERLHALTESFGTRARRIANILSGQALQQLQAKRIVSGTNSRAFTDESAALVWLRDA